MGSEDSDSMLVERVQQGESAAFDLLVLRYQHKVLKLIMRYVHDAVEAEDVAQEAFIRAYRALPSFRGDSAFYTWLYRIAINTAKNALVANRRRPVDYSLDLQDTEDYAMQARLKDPETPEGLLLTEEIQNTVNSAIENLPEDSAHCHRAARTRGSELRRNREGDGLSGRHGALAHLPGPRGDRSQAPADLRRRFGTTRGFRRMSEPLNEQLSAFIDGELPNEESELFVRQIPRDARVRATASRYYLIGQAIRAEQSVGARRDSPRGWWPRLPRSRTSDGVVAGVIGHGAQPAAFAAGRMVEASRRHRGCRGVAMVAILGRSESAGRAWAPGSAARTRRSRQRSRQSRAREARKPVSTAMAARMSTAIYVVPPKGDSPLAPLNAARLASYVFAHSDYSSLPGRRNVVSEAAVQDDSAQSAAAEAPTP